MRFEDKIKAFVNNSKSDIEARKAEAESNAKKVLQNLLGEDVSKIEDIALNFDTGKFHSVVAPEYVIAKLRDANLLENQ